MKYVIRKTRLDRVINNTNLIDTINSYVKNGTRHPGFLH